MNNAGDLLAEARRRAASGDMEGAIRLLKNELSTFAGTMEERRHIVALLITYCGRRERIDEATQIASQHLDLDPVSIVDSSIKARLVMNYAALKAAAGTIPEAISILGDILVSAQLENVSEEDILRIRTMLESLQVAEGKAVTREASLLTTARNRLRAYLASAHISQLIDGKSFSEAAQLSREILASQADLEDGPLKVALMLNLGTALVGENRSAEAEELLGQSYQIATRSLLRGGTLFTLVARSYAMSLAEAGQRKRSLDVLTNLLEAQLVRYGKEDREVLVTQRMISKITSDDAAGL